MKLEYLRPVKFTVEVWHDQLFDKFHYSIRERGLTLAVADGFQSEAEAERAAREEFCRIIEAIDHE